jgi:hypothetical protein
MPSEVLLIIFTFNLITPHQPSAKEYMVPTNLSSEQRMRSLGSRVGENTVVLLHSGGPIRM